METRNRTTLLVILTLCGLLFSGYLSAVKLFTKTCAFNEACPYFLGYPACWYGFGLFVALFIASIVALRKPEALRSALKTISVVSGVGILFAGRFVVQEVLLWLRAGDQGYALELPTCVYGLVFYLLICFLSVSGLTSKELQERV